ncbi:MAG: RelA/SpoT AH/RIS domain-containing protein [Rhodospirillales bacterium]
MVTGKARTRIRRFINAKARDEYIRLGREILKKTFADEGFDLTDKGLDGVLKIFRQPTVDDLVAQVGAGHAGARDVLEAVYPGTRKRSLLKNVVPIARARKKAQKKKPGERSIPIHGLIDGMAVHYAGCCHPLPGDRIVGIIQTGKGVTVHTIDCDQLETFIGEPERWLDLSWDVDEDTRDLHVGRVALTVLNEPGSLGNISVIIGKHEGNITNLKITDRSQDFFDLLVDIEVTHLRHLTNIIAALRAAPEINAIERARG